MAKKKSKDAVEASGIDNIKDVFSKRFGEGAIIPLSGYRADCEVIPSGSLALDIALGVGGYPRGRTIEIIGPESSGKTTLALHAVANVQKAGGVAAFIDAEHALDPVYMRNLGIDLDRALVSQPDSGEQALEMAELLVESQGVDVVVVDSVAALVPKAELEGEIGDSNIGAQARMMSGFMRRITSKVKRSNCVVVFINQIRMKIGVMFGCLHGDTLINFTDGNALPIKDVVDNRIEGEVWSYDETNNKFVPAKIIDWHNNGNVDDKSDFLSVYMRCPCNRNGFTNITVTPDHNVMTDSGWVSAEQLCIGSKVLTKQEYVNAYAEVIDIREASPRQMKQRGKYDLSIEGHHNYSAGGSHNGVIVHNSPETTPGGRALKFYSSVRLDIRKQNVISENSKESKDIIGHVAKIKVIKNKVATPFKTCNVNIIYGRGIDYELDLLDVATKIKMIEKSGSWYTYGDNRLGNGSVQAAQFLKENTDVSGELDQHIRSKFMDTDNTEQDNTEQDNTEQDNTEQESENVDVESDI